MPEYRSLIDVAVRDYISGVIETLSVDRYAGPFGAFEARSTTFFEVTPLKNSNNKNRFGAHFFHTPKGFFVESHFDAITTNHTARHADLMSGYISVSRFPVGGHLNPFQKLDPEDRLGAITIADYARPYILFSERSVLQSLFLDKKSIGLSETDVIPNRAISGRSPAARLLNAKLDRIFRQLGASQPQLIKAQVAEFIACVQLLISPRKVSPDVRAKARDALFEEICAFIESHLHDPRLGTAVLLQRFGVSRASLFRMFEAHGGVRTYIRDQRLLGAAYELSQSPVLRGKVRAVSERWGFTSQTEFNRSVRRKFGVKPGMLFKASREELSIQTDART